MKFIKNHPRLLLVVCAITTILGTIVCSLIFFPSCRIGLVLGLVLLGIGANSAISNLVATAVCWALFEDQDKNQSTKG